MQKQESRNTWSNRQTWPWNIEWSRANANRVLPRECTGHSKHPLPTTQEKTLHLDITRWPTPKSDWLYSLQSKMEKLYTVSKNKTDIKYQRYYFANKDPSSQIYGFSSSHVWMWELDYKESWAMKIWCFWTVVLEIFESSLDCKEIQPVHPKGNQSWIFIERTDAEAEPPILWPPDAKNWLIWKDPDAGKDWR